MTAVINSVSRRPGFSDGTHRIELPADESLWGTAISRFGPLSALSIERGLDEVARPDLALHSLVETMPCGGQVDIAVPNVAHADRVLELLGGDWHDRGPRRYFTRDTIVDLAGECGLTVDAVVEHRREPADAASSQRLLGDRVDDVDSFVLRCHRSHRGSIPVPRRFAEAVDYSVRSKSRTGTSHANEIELLAGAERVVEVAPASDMTRWLDELGHRVTVVDRAIPSSSSTWADRVVVGDLDVDDWSDSIEGGADAVLFGNVIEHLIDPVETLRAATRCLDRTSPRGPLVVVSVPNVAHADVRLALAAGHWRYRDNGILDRTHLHFFTERGLAELGEAANLQVVERLSTRVPRGQSINAIPWGSGPDTEAVPEQLARFVDADPTSDVHVHTWAFRPS